MLSVILAASSCGVMAALVVARLVRQQRDDKLPARSIQLTVDFLAYAKGEIGPPRLRPRSRHDCDLVMMTALDVTRALEGVALERLAGLMRSASLDRYYRRAAVRGQGPGRVAAIEFLRMFRDPETIRILREIGGSSSLRICVAALRTRIEVGDIPDLGVVLKLVEHPRGGRSLSLFKIVEACVHANLPVALALLAAGLPREAQVMVLKAIGTSRSPMALTAITRSANDLDPEVRAASITALRALGAPGSAHWFVAALRDADWRVRLKAVEGLGQHGAAADRASIEPLLNDSVWWIRFRAGEALQRLESAASLAEKSPAKRRRVGKTALTVATTKAGAPSSANTSAQTAGAKRPAPGKAKGSNAPAPRNAAKRRAAL
jgi:hypothetical protein